MAAPRPARKCVADIFASTPWPALWFPSLRSVRSRTRPACHFGIMSRASIRNTAAWHLPRLTPHGFVVNGRLMNQAATFETVLEIRARAVEELLGRLLDERIEPGEIARPARLLAAMRHGVLNGGKRLRPFLVLESAALFGADEGAALRVAAALECVHCYSLIHDDLPAMDDDDLRRGQPTVHRAFDEATAILAGDSLLTMAFDVIADEATPLAADRRAALV